MHNYQEQRDDQHGLRKLKSRWRNKMKSNVSVTNYMWAENAADITSLDFIVYKKGLFGGVKEDRSFNGWALVCGHLNTGEIDTDRVTLQDGNCYTQPLIPQLAYAVFLAGADTLKRCDEAGKAELLRKGAVDFFKKHILR